MAWEGFLIFFLSWMLNEAALFANSRFTFFLIKAGIYSDATNLVTNVYIQPEYLE